MITALILAGCSLTQTAEPQTRFSTTLDQDFRSAVPISYEFDRPKMDALRRRLLERMRIEGDERFADALSRQRDDVQTEVCNIMGLLEEPEFDRFPKSRYALSAAPKI
jgi:hypothetical protein